MRLVLGFLAVALLGAQEVHPDRTVTFRLKAPKAGEVRLWGDWILRANATEALTKDAQGQWSFTTAPLEPGLYTYVLLVDGAEVPGKLVEVPGASPLVTDFRPVPHGVVHTHSYNSPAGLGVRQVLVYTPPDYAEGKSYPTLYLLHGSGDTETSWMETGRVHWMADNLIAAGKAKPMVIVMANGRGPARKESETDLLEGVVPLVETNYRVIRSARSRAIAGQSMGGFQALWLGLDHPEVFGSIGTFAGGIWDDEGKQQVARYAARPEHQMRLFYIAAGDRDMNLTLARRLDETLAEHGIRHVMRVGKGQGHAWPYWRSCLADFLEMVFQ